MTVLLKNGPIASGTAWSRGRAPWVARIAEALHQTSLPTGAPQLSPEGIFAGVIFATNAGVPREAKDPSRGAFRSPLSASPSRVAFPMARDLGVRFKLMGNSELH